MEQQGEDLGFRCNNCWSLRRRRWWEDGSDSQVKRVNGTSKAGKWSGGGNSKVVEDFQMEVPRSGGVFQAGLLEER